MPSIKKIHTFLGYDLFTTAFIVGWIGLVFSILAFSVGIALNEALSNASGDLLLFKAALKGISHFQIFGCLISAFLIAGVVKKNSIFLLPWLICNGIELSILLLGIIIGVIATIGMLFIGNFEAIGITFLCWIVFGPIYSLWLLLWVAIRSLYTTLREKESNVENIGLTNAANLDQPNGENYGRLRDTMLRQV